MCGRFAQYENIRPMLRHFTLNLVLILEGYMKILANIMCAPDLRLSFRTRELGRNHMIIARGETAASSKIYQQLCCTG